MEEVEFENPRGLNLKGNFFPCDSERGVVMAHGFTGSKEQYGKFTHIAVELNEAGFNVLNFDFSGCGESEDDTIGFEKEVEDLEAAVKYIEERGVEKIGLLGLSQGGTVCLEYGNVDAMVLINPLTSGIPDYSKKLSEEQLEKLEEKGFSFREKKGEGRNRYRFSKELIEKKETLDQKSLLESVECPVLLIQGSRDDTISLEDSRRAVEKLGDARLSIIDDDHYFKHSLRKVSDLSVAFFEEKMKK